MTTQEQAAHYVQKHQYELGLALLVVMKEASAENCEYSLRITGPKGDKYIITTRVEKV